MKIISEPRVRARIFAGFGAISAILVVVLTMALLTLNKSQRSQRQILEENFGNLYDLPSLRSNLNAQRLAVAIMLESPRDEWGPWLDEIDQRRKTGDSIINNLILRFRNVPAESRLLGSLISARDEYHRLQNVQESLLINGENIGEAKQLFLVTQMKNFAQIRSVIQTLEKSELGEARRMVDATEVAAAASTREFLIIGILGVLIVLSLAYYIIRTIDLYVKEVDSAHGATNVADRALHMINACRAIAIRASDETQLLENVCKSIIDLGGYKMAWVGYADDDRNKSVRPMAFSGDDGDYIEHAKISWGDNERGHGPTGTCIRTGEIVVAKDTSTEPGYEPWRFRASEKGYRSTATFPLKNGDRTYGALMVYSVTLDAFDERETELLKELAGDLAYATTSLRDQSARVQAERKARESASYARNLLEASLDPLIVISPAGKITDVNAAMERVTGKSRLELLGLEFAGCFTDPGRATAGHREALQKGFIRDYALLIKHVSGAAVEVVYNATVVRGETGEVVGVFAAAREMAVTGLDPA